MRDYKFYGEGMDPRRGGQVVVLTRRVLRRLLRPIFYRQAALFEELGAEIENLSARVARLEADAKTTGAVGSDLTALTRRLAAIEDRLNRYSENGKAVGVTASR